MLESEFCVKNQLDIKREIDKVAYLAFFVQTSKKQNFFSIEEVVQIMLDNNLCNPNIYRLKTNIKHDNRFIVKGKNFALTQKSFTKLKDECVYDDFEYVESSSEFIDESLFVDVPTYMIKLVKQINCAYKNNLYDAAAVLVRRVFENLLIKAYKNHGISDEIKKNGSYIMLEKIIDNAVQNKTLDLSRSRKELDSVREIGNYSAHKMDYNCNINDLNKIKENYRCIMEELLYKSGLKK